MGLGSLIGSALSKVSQKGEEMVISVMKKSRPPPLPITNANDLQALDNTAFRVNGQWVAEFVISVFDRCDEEKVHKFEKYLSSLLDVERGEIFWERIQYFVAVPKENFFVQLRHIDANAVFSAGSTQSNGIMNPELVIPSEGMNWIQGSQAVFDVITPPGFPERYIFRTIFAEETGYGVISGIYFLILVILICRCR
jgi:hypothetical protein